MSSQEKPMSASSPTSSSTNTKTKAWQFSNPLIISPTEEHRQTFIFLHGRGSTANEFAYLLLATPSITGETIQTTFPSAKLVFLTASRNRARIYNRSYTHQWFDHWYPNKSTERQELMIPGLKISCTYLHGILQQEINEIGKDNVILWGLSQGCATAVTSLLTWGGEPFAAVIGMCGYLPFGDKIENIAAGEILEIDENCKEDLFSHSGDEDEDLGKGGLDDQDPTMQAVAFLRQEIEMEDKIVLSFKKVPVFLGHGIEDQKVYISLGREMRRCLDALGISVQMMEYEGLGHWYSEAMLTDIFDFLKARLRTEDNSDAT